MKILLLDADGVVLNKGEYFSEKYAREYSVPPESVVEFFRGPFVACQAGEADLKVEIEPYLVKWGWFDGVDAFLEYWFTSDFHPNETGLATIKKIREAGVKCFIASNNEKYRASFLREKLNEMDALDGYFFSSEMKVRKKDPAFFTQVLSELHVTPEETHFIDNEQENVDSASSVGIQAHLYEDGLLEELLAKI